MFPLCLVLAALLMLPACGQLPFLPSQQRELVPYEIVLEVEAPVLNENGTRIPVHVSGADANDSPVDLDAYVAYDGTGLELPAGSYDITVQGSPIAPNGIIYNYDDVQVSIEVPYAEDESTVYGVPSGHSLVLPVRVPEEMTEQDVAEALEWAQKDSESTVDAEYLASLADSIRKGAQEQPTSEVEEKKAELPEVPSPDEEDAEQKALAMIEGWWYAPNRIDLESDSHEPLFVVHIHDGVAETLYRDDATQNTSIPLTHAEYITEVRWGPGMEGWYYPEIERLSTEGGGSLFKVDTETHTLHQSNWYVRLDSPPDWVV